MGRIKQRNWQMRTVASEPGPRRWAFQPRERTVLDIHRLLSVLSTKLGDRYDLHQQVPPWDGAWNGPWNCSAFLAWGLWQAGDRRMLGCRLFPPPHSNATFPEWWKACRIWAWT